MNSSVIEPWVSDIPVHCNTINEHKVCVHCTYGGERPFRPFFGMKHAHQKMEKTGFVTQQCKANCDSSQRSYSCPKGLFNFPISAVAYGDCISQNMMLLFFHYACLPFTPPPLLLSKWLRDAASMNVVNGVLKGSFSAL